jgi:MFS transporter, DHA2 family, multidrug resistance protein
VNFAAHTSHGDPNFEQWLAGLKSMFIAQGYDAATGAQKALAAAYSTVQAQADALSFKNSFWIMSIIILFLTPLPFIMRRPKASEQKASSLH